MNYTIKSVKALEDYTLLLTFIMGEKKIYDMKPHLGGGIFEELKDEKMFKKVRVSFDTVVWENGADFDPEVLYRESRSEKEEPLPAKTKPCCKIQTLAPVAGLPPYLHR